ncbi:MAG: HAD-IC family P-type ATPase, partial [Anaeroplasmataceae bacterium]
FRNSGVEVKVISGDNPLSVSKVSEKAGIENANDYISLDGLSDDEVRRVANSYTVFGRVSPYQKRILVQTLKENKKTVAMTGDGVNDILALKEADCSIAVASGSEAARNVSHLVLLDSNFDSMPKVVAEGRRVINNVAKVACLFLTKTIFSLLLAIYALNMDGTYPISTNQLLMIDFLCIGAPSFFLILEPNNLIAKGNFFLNIIKGALPGAIVILINSIMVFALASELNMNAQVQSTVIVVTATFTSMMVLLQTCRPFTFFKKTMFVTLFSVFALITVLLPQFFDFNPLTGIGDYYDSSLRVETIEEVPSISISAEGRYVVNGQYTSKTYSGAGLVKKNNGGYLYINNQNIEYKIEPKASYAFEDTNFNVSNNDLLIVDSYITKVKYDERLTYDMRILPNGDVVFNGYFTGLNILPEVQIESGKFIINGVLTDITTDSGTVQKVEIYDNKLHINNSKVEYTIEKPIVSYVEIEDGLMANTFYFAVGGHATEYTKQQIRNENISISISEDSDFNYLFTKSGVTTTSEFTYSLDIERSKEGKYVLDGTYTDFDSNGDRNTFTLSVDENGYLIINGVETNFKVNLIITIGGTVQRLTLSSILLMVTLCVLSLPLIELLKQIIPWIRSQIKNALNLLNKL